MEEFITFVHTHILGLWKGFEVFEWGLGNQNDRPCKWLVIKQSPADKSAKKKTRLRRTALSSANKNFIVRAVSLKNPRCKQTLEMFTDSHIDYDDGAWRIEK